MKNLVLSDDEVGNDRRMTEGLGLAAGQWQVQLSGFRPPGFDAGVKIDLYLPADALRQLTDHGVTGGVAGANLSVALEGVELRDAMGSLSIAEVVLMAAKPE